MLIPHKQLTSKIQPNTGNADITSLSQYEASIEHANKKPAVVDYYAGERFVTTNRKKNNKTEIAKNSDQGAQKQKSIKKKYIHRTAYKQKQDATTFLRLISFTSYWRAVSWLAQHSPTFTTSKQVILWGKQTRIQMPSTIVGTYKRCTWVDRITAYEQVKTSRNGHVISGLVRDWYSQHVEGREYKKRPVAMIQTIPPSTLYQSREISTRGRQANKTSPAGHNTRGSRSTAGIRQVVPIVDGYFSLLPRSLTQPTTAQLRYGKKPAIVEAEKQYQLTTLSGINQQDRSSRNALQAQVLPSWGIGDFSDNNIESNHFNSKKEKGQTRVSEKGRQSNHHAHWVLLKLASFGEIQAAKAKIMKAVRSWLRNKGKKVFYDHFHKDIGSENTKKETCCDWFYPLEECLMTKMARWQEKAKIHSSQVSITSNKGYKTETEKENIPPLSKSQLHRDYDSIDNSPFTTPLKLRAYAKHANQGDWTASNMLTNRETLFSSTEKEERADSPEGQIFWEAERRLEEAVQLLESLEYDPNQDVHAVIDKITTDQENILERMERASHERQKDSTDLSFAEKSDTPINKRMQKPKQLCPEQEAICPEEKAYSPKKDESKRRKEEKNHKDSSKKGIKGIGDVGKKGVSTDLQKISILERIALTVESTLKNHKTNQNTATQRRRSTLTRSKEKVSNKIEGSAYALRRAYSESLLNRRVSADSTNIKSRPHAVTRRVPATP